MGRRTQSSSPVPRSSSSSAEERGFTLAGLIVIMTIIAIIVAYTVPKQWSLVMARERDRQTIFAMKQYTRAILAFQDKNKAFPTSLQQLKEARNPRFMRGKGEIPDPLTGEVDWVLLPVGTPPVNGPSAPGAPPVPPPTGTATTATQQQPNGQAGSQTLAGGFVGVRPGKTGKSFVAFNGKENYEEWTYTVDDLKQEIEGRKAALLKK